jgi:copper chaperone CopZ
MEANCHVPRMEKSATRQELAVTQTVRLGISGMGCPNCAARVRNGLISLAGVVEAAVDHVTGTAGVIFNPELVSVEDMLIAVARAGNDGKHNYRAAIHG